MKITITGPRSVGKSTISKIVADKLKLEYISSDALGDRAFREQGGLDKAIKSGELIRIVNEGGGYTIVLEEFKKDNFVFDLSGGSVSSTKMIKASEEVRKTARENSVVFGLLPSKDSEKSVEILSKRESERAHFKHMAQEEVYAQTKKSFEKYPPLFETFCNYIIYTEEKTPEEIADEIVEKIDLK